MGATTCREAVISPALALNAKCLDALSPLLLFDGICDVKLIVRAERPSLLHGLAWVQSLSAEARVLPPGVAGRGLRNSGRVMTW